MSQPSTDRATARPRAVLYLRQSTYREESISLELQETAGREYARRQGYEVVAVESDPGISGRTWNRDGVQKVMGMVEQRQADVIVLWKWSRLSRSRLDWAVAVDKVESLGGRIESATEPVDTTTSTGRLARGMLAEFAAFESERIGDTWREAHDRRLRNGLPHSGQRRFGYDYVDGQFVPNETEAPLIVEAFRRYNNGDGATRIARWLNTTGTTTTKGGDWHRVAVQSMLDSGFAAGKIRRRNPLTYHPGNHPALIDEDVWNAYLKNRKTRRRAPRVIEPTYMLAGLVRCGHCGAPMHASGTDGYVCSAAAAGKPTPKVTMRRERTEQAVEEWLFDRAARIDEIAAQLDRSRQRQVRSVNSRAAIEARIKKLDDRMAKLTVRWLDNVMPDAAYEATVAKLNSERASLEARASVEDISEPAEKEALQLVTSVADIWPHATIAERRRLLGKLIHEVRIERPPRAGTGVWRERVKVIALWEK